MNPALLLSLVLLGASVALARQADAPQPAGASPVLLDAMPFTNAALQAIQAAPAGESEGPEGIPGPTDVNEAPDQGQTTPSTQAGDESPGSSAQGAARRRDGRQSRQNRFAREKQRARPSRDGLGSGSGSGTNGLASLDYSAFRDIVTLNIFDPNRVPSGPPRVREPSAEYFGLVGTMRYDKGTFAVFNGSDSRYSKVLKVSDSIAGYKLIDIAADSVKLLRSTNSIGADSVKTALDGATNEVEMRMKQQMRREPAGPWQLSSESSSYAASSSFTPILGSESSGTNSAAPTGGESDILKRMMQRRDSESK
jgi:hypothetical protein